MTVLLKTRCTKGHLIVYDDKVSIEALKLLGYQQSNSLTHKQITGVEIQMTQPDILGLGQATVKIFSTGNQTLVADRVNLKDAKEVEKLINERISK